MDRKSGGLTLIKMIVMISILRIIAAVADRRLAGFRGKTEGSVCTANRKNC